MSRLVAGVRHTVRFVVTVGITWGVYLQTLATVIDLDGANRAVAFVGVSVAYLALYMAFDRVQRFLEPRNDRTRFGRVRRILHAVLEPFALGAFSVAMLTVPVVIYAALGLGAVFLGGAGAERAGWVGAVAAVALGATLLGGALNAVFARSASYFMRRGSGAKKVRTRRRKVGDKGRRKTPPRRVVDADGVGSAAATKSALADADRAERRRVALWFFAPPLASLVALLATALALGGSASPGGQAPLRTATPVAGIMLLLLALLRAYDSGRIGRRAPMRQIHLVFDLLMTCLGMFVVGGLATFGLNGLGVTRRASFGARARQHALHVGRGLVVSSSTRAVAGRPPPRRALGGGAIDSVPGAEPPPLSSARKPREPRPPDS